MIEIFLLPHSRFYSLSNYFGLTLKNVVWLFWPKSASGGIKWTIRVKPMRDLNSNIIRAVLNDLVRWRDPSPPIFFFTLYFTKWFSNFTPSAALPTPPSLATSSPDRRDLLLIADGHERMLLRQSSGGVKRPPFTPHWAGGELNSVRAT